MSALIINDLELSKDLDRTAMKEINGGWRRVKKWIYGKDGKLKKIVIRESGRKNKSSGPSFGFSV